MFRKLWPAAATFTLGILVAVGATQLTSTRTVTCELNVPPPPPGYPAYNPHALAQRLVYPADGQCPDVPGGWSPWSGRTACTWRPDLSMWTC